MKPATQAKNPLFREKPAKTLVALTDQNSEWYASSLAKKIDCTFPHMIKTLSVFSDLGLVSFKERGRKKLVFLTPKGKKIASLVKELFFLLKT